MRATYSKPWNTTKPRNLASPVKSMRRLATTLRTTRSFASAPATPRIAICGAGVSGLTLAGILSNGTRDVQLTVFERARRDRDQGYGLDLDEHGQEALVRAGESMDRIVLVATGSVDSYETAPDGSLKRLYRYRAKRDIARPQDSTVNSFQVPIRGCVIGGTAFLDPSVRAQPYPSTALAAEPARVVEFSYGALRSAMDENPAIEAAILNVLYFDLVEGLRRRGQYDYAAKEAARKATGGPVAPRKLPTIMQEDVRVTMYELIMRVALADGVVHSAEREFLAKYQMENAITDEEHIASLAANGWTAAQWDAGVQEGQLEGGAAAIKSAIPDLLTQAGIKSRLTTDRGKEKK